MLHLEKPTTKSPHIAVKPENSHKKKKERKERSFLCFGQDPLCNLQGPVQHKNMGPVQQEKHFNFEMIVQISFFKNLEAEIWDFKREEGNAHEDGQANI